MPEHGVRIAAMTIHVALALDQLVYVPVDLPERPFIPDSAQNQRTILEQIALHPREQCILAKAARIPDVGGVTIQSRPDVENDGHAPRKTLPGREKLKTRC